MALFVEGPRQRVGFSFIPGPLGAACLPLLSMQWAPVLRARHDELCLRGNGEVVAGSTAQ
jgi:hypothetical protein